MNKDKIIQSKNTGVLEVVTNLIFRDQQSMMHAVQRSLLLRLNTPSSIVLFFRDRMIFQKRVKFNDIAVLVQQMQNLNVLLIFPGQIALQKHMEKGLCKSQCYFCHLKKPIEVNFKNNYLPEQLKIIELSNDIRSMKYHKEYIFVDCRLDQSVEIISQSASVFKVRQIEQVEAIQERFLSSYIQQKGKKHFVFILTKFSFEHMELCDKKQLQFCKKIISILNSLSFPLLSILEGGFEAYVQSQILEQNKQKNSGIDQSKFQPFLNQPLPFCFPLTISDRFLLGSALSNRDASTFVGIVEILFIFDNFILIVPIQKQLLTFINHFQHNTTVIQYLYEKTHIPASIVLHKAISISCLKKASMKIHNQNILVLLYDSCQHQEKRIFEKISSYFETCNNELINLAKNCQKCQKTKKKIVIQMDSTQQVKDCTSLLTKKFMQIRKKNKQIQN